MIDDAQIDVLATVTLAALAEAGYPNVTVKRRGDSLLLDGDIPSEPVWKATELAFAAVGARGPCCYRCVMAAADEVGVETRRILSECASTRLLQNDCGVLA